MENTKKKNPTIDLSSYIGGQLQVFDKKKEKHLLGAISEINFIEAGKTVQIKFDWLAIANSKNNLPGVWIMTANKDYTAKVEEMEFACNHCGNQTFRLINETPAQEITFYLAGAACVDPHTIIKYCSKCGGSGRLGDDIPCNRCSKEVSGVGV